MNEFEITLSIRFVGKYAELKNMGFTFQKLFAGNYMQWSKGHIRVWKYGEDVTIDMLTNFEGNFLKILLANKQNKVPLLPVDKESGRVIVYQNEVTGEIFLTPEEFNKACEATRNELLEECRTPEGTLDPKTQEIISKMRIHNADWQKKYHKQEDLNPLLELIDKGWIELKEW